MDVEALWIVSGIGIPKNALRRSWVDELFRMASIPVSLTSSMSHTIVEFPEIVLRDQYFCVCMSSEMIRWNLLFSWITVDLPIREFRLEWHFACTPMMSLFVFRGWGWYQARTLSPMHLWLRACLLSDRNIFWEIWSAIHLNRPHSIFA